MTLRVGLYREKPDGHYESVPFDPTPGHNDQAGAERWRQTVYGSERAKKLGLHLLPTLAEGCDIYAAGSDLNLLKHEVEVLKADYLREFEEMKARHEEVAEGDRSLVSRLDNILEAVQFALDNHGLYGVCIE